MTDKKIATLLLISLLILSGCTGFETNRKKNILETVSSHENLPDTFNNGNIAFSMTSDTESYKLPVDDITLIISNSGSSTVGFGEQRTLEKLQEETWHEVPYSKQFAFTDIGLGLEAKEHLEQKMPLEFLDYELTAGTYRVVKTFYINEGKEEIALATEFKIKQ